MQRSFERAHICLWDLRSNRKGNPKYVCKKKLKKGEVYGQENEDGIRVIKWLDKRPVLMISFVPTHTDVLIPTGSKNRRGEDVFKPPAVIAYSIAKKGDVSDQMSSYHTSRRKSLKWYKKVIFEIMLGTCVVNAWVVHNNFSNHGKKMDMLRFREKIIQGLLNTEIENADVDGGGDRADKENVDQTKKRKRGKSSHRMGKYEGPARKNRKRCIGCFKRIQQEKGSKEARIKTSKVLTFCEDCDEQPCFKKTHE